MFESALGNLCIVICGMTVLLSAFFIWRTETLPNRLIVAAAAALVLIFRWQISMMIHLLAHRTVRGRRAALRPALCAHPSLPALRGVKGWSTRSR